MLFVISSNGNSVGIYDTSDKTTEVYSNVELLHILRSNDIEIGGLVLADDKSSFRTYCSSDNAVNEFVLKIQPTLCKLRVISNASRDEQIRGIYTLAKRYGFVKNDEDFRIDIDNCAIMLKSLEYVYSWENQGVTQYDLVDVRSNDVIKLSGLGKEAFDYMYLDIGGKKIKMTELLSELSKATNAFDLRCVYYIGITPSNSMFKFVIDRGWAGSSACYSVKFDTIDVLTKNCDKISGNKQNAAGFVYYVRRKCGLLGSVNGGNFGSNDFAITKISDKHISPYAVNIVSTLKSKYKTIHDVYIRGS